LVSVDVLFPKLAGSPKFQLVLRKKVRAAVRERERRNLVIRMVSERLFEL